ncbi:hypothetical protein PR048_010771 [Dryococelus australis]|uniref:Uncharacterized protein n=1 Tax=Dryococelus australis TaxID=614101 RepID=A0ABQ9I3L8_9NEOP|nr:hypothetical protein PR048_010771 [Dryococelus australis]
MRESCLERCRWSAGFLGDLPFPPPLHSGAAPSHLISPSLHSTKLTQILTKFSSYYNTIKQSVKTGTVDLLIKYEIFPYLFPGTSHADVARRVFVFAVRKRPSLRKLRYLLCQKSVQITGTRQKAKPKYRNRIRLERASQKQSSDTRKTPHDGVKRSQEQLLQALNLRCPRLRCHLDNFTSSFVGHSRKSEGGRGGHSVWPAVGQSTCVWQQETRTKCIVHATLTRRMRLAGVLHDVLNSLVSSTVTLDAVILSIPHLVRLTLDLPTLDFSLFRDFHSDNVTASVNVSMLEDYCFFRPSLHSAVEAMLKRCTRCKDAAYLDVLARLRKRSAGLIRTTLTRAPDAPSLLRARRSTGVLRLGNATKGENMPRRVGNAALEWQRDTRGKFFFFSSRPETIDDHVLTRARCLDQRHSGWAASLSPGRPDHCGFKGAAITVSVVSMERCRNERAGETGDPRENPLTNGIVRHGLLTPTGPMLESLAGDGLQTSLPMPYLGFEPRASRTTDWWRTNRPRQWKSAPCLNEASCSDGQYPFHILNAGERSYPLSSSLSPLHKKTTKAPYFLGSASGLALLETGRATSLPDFRTRESCRTIPLVGGEFSRGSPISPALVFRRCSILASLYPLSGLTDLVVKSLCFASHLGDSPCAVLLDPAVAGVRLCFMSLPAINTHRGFTNLTLYPKRRSACGLSLIAAVCRFSCVDCASVVGMAYPHRNNWLFRVYILFVFFTQGRSVSARPRLCSGCNSYGIPEVARQEHCTAIEDLVLRGDGAPDARGSIALIVHSDCDDSMAKLGVSKPSAVRVLQINKMHPYKFQLQQHLRASFALAMRRCGSGLNRPAGQLKLVRTHQFWPVQSWTAQASGKVFQFRFCGLRSSPVASRQSPHTMRNSSSCVGTFRAHNIADQLAVDGSSSQSRGRPLCMQMSALGRYLACLTRERVVCEGAEAERVANSCHFPSTSTCEFAHTSPLTEQPKIPEKTRRPAASSGTIPNCENPAVTRSGIEPGSPWWEASLLIVQPPRSPSYHAGADWPTAFRRVVICFASHLGDSPCAVLLDPAVAGVRLCFMSLPAINTHRGFTNLTLYPKRRSACGLSLIAEVCRFSCVDCASVVGMAYPHRNSC